MDGGSLADWVAAGGAVVAAVGTVGALGVALSLLREDRRLRAVAQATHVSVWAEWRRSSDRYDLSERQFFAYINNAGDAPIYVEDLRAGFEGSGPIGPVIQVGTVPAGGTSDYGLSEVLFPPGGEVPYLQIRFLDTNRVWWLLDSRARLTRVGRRDELSGG